MISLHKICQLITSGALCAALCPVLFLAGCRDPVNAPRDIADYSANSIFSSFSGRSPKTLDPQVSYSSDETIYTYQVYEALYQYHYLKHSNRFRQKQRNSCNNFLFCQSLHHNS